MVLEAVQRQRNVAAGVIWVLSRCQRFFNLLFLCDWSYFAGFERILNRSLLLMETELVVSYDTE